MTFTHYMHFPSNSLTHKYTHIATENIHTDIHTNSTPSEDIQFRAAAKRKYHIGETIRRILPQILKKDLPPSKIRIKAFARLGIYENER